MLILARCWRLLTANRLRLIALVVIVSLLAPPPANAQFGFILGSLISMITEGLGTLNNIMTGVNNALRNVIAPILTQINSAMSAVQGLVQWVLDFQRSVIYPQSAINAARALIGQVQSIYATIRGYWNVVVQSATLPNPQQLEAVILSRNVNQIASVSATFTAVYTPLPAAADAHRTQRDLMDSSDAAAQAAMKRAIAIDAVADQELAAADQMMTALQSTAPGTAEMIGAQAGAWVVRSQAYTQQALGEVMRLRAIDLAAQSARAKEAARFARETRTKITEVNR
jgi:hypothetical protein